MFERLKQLGRELIDPVGSERERLTPDQRDAVSIVEESIANNPSSWMFELQDVSKNLPSFFVPYGATQKRHTILQQDGTDYQLREFRAVPTVHSACTPAIPIQYNSLYSRENDSQGDWQLVIGDPHSFLAQELLDKLRYAQNSALGDTSFPDACRENRPE